MKKSKLEPVGSVAPKVSVADELTVARVTLDHSISILCPAQSYPVPRYGWAYPVYPIVRP